MGIATLYLSILRTEEHNKIGLESKTTGGEITFSFHINGLDNQNIQFEDNQTGVLRTIDSSNGPILLR